jgi:hypothetical protein
MSQSADTLSYLNALGITAWVRRDAPSEEGGQPLVTEDREHAVSESPNVQPEVAEMEAPLSPAPEVPDVPPAPPLYTPASLPSFPSQMQGKYLIVCQHQEGDAFSGDVAVLMDKMLQATQWPADTCVLLNNLNGDSQAIIDAISPTLIVCMGQSAFAAVTGQGVALENVRGKSLTQFGLPLVATYHPSQVHQDPQLKRPLWEDLKLAMSLA